MTRILVVEDEPGIALGLRNDLTLEGYSVEVAGDGETALERGRAGPFDLILLDVMLPRKDGFAVCRELRRAGVKTPVILLALGTSVDVTGAVHRQNLQNRQILLAAGELKPLNTAGWLVL